MRIVFPAAIALLLASTAAIAEPDYAAAIRAGSASLMAMPEAQFSV